MLDDILLKLQSKVYNRPKLSNSRVLSQTLLCCVYNHSLTHSPTHLAHFPPSFLPTSHSHLPEKNDLSTRRGPTLHPTQYNPVLSNQSATHTPGRQHRQHVQNPYLIPYTQPRYLHEPSPCYTAYYQAMAPGKAMHAHPGEISLPRCCAVCCGTETTTG